MELARTTGSWTGRPHFSADGNNLYFTARIDKVSKYANVFRLSLGQQGAQPEAVTDLAVTFTMAWYRRMESGWPSAATPKSGSRECSRTF